MEYNKKITSLDLKVGDVVYVKRRDAVIQARITSMVSKLGYDVGGYLTFSTNFTLYAANGEELDSDISHRIYIYESVEDCRNGIYIQTRAFKNDEYNVELGDKYLAEMDKKYHMDHEYNHLACYYYGSAQIYKKHFDDVIYYHDGTELKFHRSYWKNGNNWLKEEKTIEEYNKEGIWLTKEEACKYNLPKVITFEEEGEDNDKNATTIRAILTLTDKASMNDVRDLLSDYGITMKIE